TTRALARPFTYELVDRAAKGAVVSVPLGRSRRRGVVVELVDEAPAGIEPVPIDSVLDELPPVLVDLALWVADYYGSTPGRALGRFQARFGNAVALLHSGLTDAERRDERERIARGEARLVVGARSAVFAALRDVGVICVDEEHDQSYKQESDPRYDARTVVAKRAALEGAVAIYGSATPRPES